MTKRYDEAIEVVPDPVARVPLAFSWRGRRYEVDQQLSSWLEGAEWWAPRTAEAVTSNGRVGKGARDRQCFRVLARPAGTFATGDLDADGYMAPPSSGASAVYDLAFDRIKRVWRLARIWD